jgi:hypothetical protein
MNMNRIVWCMFIGTIISGNHIANGKDNPTNLIVQAQAKNDSLFNKPYIDTEEWRNDPVRHLYIHGGFEGTNTRFSFYFPEKSKYKNRFYQYITPFPDNETLSQGASGPDDKIGFSIASGAYFIETNGGGKADFSRPAPSNDALIGAFKANAAAARFSRAVASRLFGTHRPFGYAFGGSGGAYRTIGGMENTENVWDGVVPYVVGSPMAIPNSFTIRMHAMRILKDKFPQIIDALEPGGSGDMYAGLNAEEKEALLEATRMGFPPGSWFGYRSMGIHGFLVLYQGVVMADRKYFTDDFWKVPGYLGENPTSSLLKARIQKVSKIKAGIPVELAVSTSLTEAPSANERGSADLAWKSMGGKEGTMPVAFQLEDALPDVGFLGGDLIIKTGAAAGKTIQLTKILDDKVVIGPSDPALLVLIKPGDEVQVDNSNFLAVQTYHRHQVPGTEYTAWDQFRDREGKPAYPQRPFLIGPSFTRAASGVVPTGKFKGKMILLSSLWDREAFPWQADWYHARVKEHLGDSTENHFRLWYTDHALHGDIYRQEDPTRTISYLGVLQQALLDLSDWVEKGVAPAASTKYNLEDGQITVPATAAERRGIQPVVSLRVNGKQGVTIKPGQSVMMEAIVEVPPHTGKIVTAEWDFNALGTFPVKGKLIMLNKEGSRAKVKIRHTFKEPGTHFPVLRVSSQREGNPETPFTQIQNLDRVRVVVIQ